MSRQFICVSCVNGAISCVSRFDICVSWNRYFFKNLLQIGFNSKVWSLNIVQQYFPVHFQFTFVFFVFWNVASVD